MTAAARFFLCCYLFALPIMQPPVPLAGFLASPADFLFLPLACLCGLLLLTRRLPLSADPAFPFIAAYFAAMLLSAVLSGDPAAAVPKIGTQVYLLSLPFFTVLLVRDKATLRLACLSWLAGSMLVAAIAVASLALFVTTPGHLLLSYTTNIFGTLPPGDYPRLRLTFLNANLACNYLSVSLLILLAAQRAGWIKGAFFATLLVGIFLAAASTLSPGLGGIALALGLWLAICLRASRPHQRRAILSGSLLVAFLSLIAASVTPLLHPTAPFLIPVPLSDVVLAPSVRLMIWLESVQNFFDNPWTGRGIGAHAVDLVYVSPSGDRHRMTDSHNMFLHIAVQCGLVGLLSLALLLVHLASRSLPLRVPADTGGILRLALGLALLVGLVFQGLTGSFEDARHLWAAIGLYLAASRLEPAHLDGTRGRP